MHEIKKLRKITKIRQAEMSQRLNVSKSRYWNMENGVISSKDIDKTRKKSLSILLPALDKIIEEKEAEAADLKVYRDSFKQDVNLKIMSDIRELRKKSGMKQYKLSNLLRMDTSQYCSLENGRSLHPNLHGIRERCFTLLLGALDKVIKEKSIEVGKLTVYRKSFNQSNQDESQ